MQFKNLKLPTDKAVVSDTFLEGFVLVFHSHLSAVK